MKQMCIYQIKNKLNGYIYVGSTVNYDNRVAGHKSKLKLNKHGNYKLQLHHNALGISAFEFEVLAIVRNKDELKTKEKEWGNKVSNHFYNVANPGENFTKEAQIKGTAKSSVNTGARNKALRSRPVIAIDPLSNQIIHEFPSTKEAGRCGFDQGNICKAVNGKLKTHAGYIWRYI